MVKHDLLLILLSYQESGGQDGYAAISSVDKQRQEPEKIRLWREEQKERLATKGKFGPLLTDNILGSLSLEDVNSSGE